MSTKSKVLTLKDAVVAGRSIPVILLESLAQTELTVGDFLAYCETNEHIEAAVSARIAAMAPTDVEAISPAAVFTAPKVIRQSPYGKHQPGALKQARAAMRRNPFGEN